MKNFYSPPIRPDELYHYGIARRSGRYPYGSGDRPYQREEKRKQAGTFFSKMKQKKEDKSRQKKEELTRQIEQAKKIKAENRDRILQSGKASEVLQYKGELSNQELKQVLERLKLEKDLGDYANFEVQSGFDKMDKVMKDFDKVINWGNTGAKAWNLFAGAYNASLSENETPLKTINTSGKK